MSTKQDVQKALAEYKQARSARAANPKNENLVNAERAAWHALTKAIERRPYAVTYYREGA